MGNLCVAEEAEALPSLVDKLNERFGTDFIVVDQLLFDQIRATAEGNEQIVEAARASNLGRFQASTAPAKAPWAAPC